MQLHRRARRLGSDRVEVGDQVLGGRRERVAAGDVEPDGLAAVGEHLLVEQQVAVVRGDGVLDQVPVGQRRQDPDHGQLGAVVQRLGPGHREFVEELLLEMAPLHTGQRPRRQVQLEVPAAQLRLELRRPERVQHGPAGPVGSRSSVPTRLSSTSRPVIGSSRAKG